MKTYEKLSLKFAQKIERNSKLEGKALNCKKSEKLKRKKLKERKI